MTDTLSAPPPGPQRWTPGRVYQLYRLLLAMLLAGLFLLNRDDPLIGEHDPQLFFHTILTYLGVALLVPLVPQPGQAARRTLAMLGTLSLDILFLTLLVHASGGIASNLTILLLVTVAAGNILLPGRLGLVIAALSTLAVMFEDFYFSLGEIGEDPFHLTTSALLGLAFFAVALITGQLTLRLARSEAMMERQSRAIARLEAMNQKVVERMRTGVIVFDRQRRIVLVNQSARSLLGDPAPTGKRLPEPLICAHEQWRQHPEKQPGPVTLSDEAPEHEVGLASLDTGDDQLIIAFLEDRSRLMREAQELKLASLGRLSATIAHEIRNPLSAINHAAELLGDDTDDTSDAERLLGIIRTHVGRVNRIIDDVLGLSRRPTSGVRIMEMQQVLDMCRECWAQAGQPPEQLRIHAATQQQVRFDPEQLRRILENLLENARVHGGKGPVEVTSGVYRHTELPWLEVRDQGPGISDEVREHLFEPFFTTSRQGNGLGLFLSRELCESNQARLEYHPANPGSAFVITFAHPDRGFE